MGYKKEMVVVFINDIPKNIKDIFYPADYNWFLTSGHAVSTKKIEYFANKKS